MRNREPGRALLFLSAAVLVSVFLAKAWLAATVPLFGDEAFYWQESRNPASAYSDLPLMTAMLVGVGTTLAGDTYLGVRLAFLALGLLLPWLVFRLARDLGAGRDALPAAAATTCVPLAASLGVLALPDVPLTVFALAGLLCLCRAAGSGAVRWWVLAGVFGALGLCTHYRFIAWLIGPVCWLFLTADGRSHLRAGGPWIAMTVALAGLAPVALFNLEHEMAGLSFQFLERHPWTWQAEGWRFTVTQIMVVTPLMFVAILSAVYRACRSSGDFTAARLVPWFSVLPFLGFSAAAFFTDAERTSAHWPLVAYLPVLAWVPATLRSWPAWCRFLPPLTGLAGTAALFLWLAVAGSPQSLGGLTGNKSFPDNLTGWREVSQRVSEFRRELTPEPGVLVAGNFMLAAELDFELGGERVYVLAHPLNEKHGRALQLRIWDMDETAMHRRETGRRALIVIEDTALKIDGKPAWARRLCTRFSGVRFLGEQVLYEGRKRFLHFSGRVRAEPGPDPHRPVPSNVCDLPPFAYLAQPLGDARLSGPVEIFGWAVEDNRGVESVELLVDGRPVADLSHGEAWPDVARFLPGSVDPLHPNVGFRAEVTFSGLEPGEHLFSIRVTSRDGNVRELEHRRVTVAD